MAVASVVIPAHNEGSSIGRTLRALRTGVGEDDLDVVVVCNGCTDATAAVARQTDPRALVIEIAQPSKREAVRVGNAATHVFPASISMLTSSCPVPPSSTSWNPSRAVRRSPRRLCARSRGRGAHPW